MRASESERECVRSSESESEGVQVEAEWELRHAHDPCLHPAPCTLHPAPCTLHPAPCTLHPAPPSAHQPSQIEQIVDLLKRSANRQIRDYLLELSGLVGWKERPEKERWKGELS